MTGVGHDLVTVHAGYSVRVSWIGERIATEASFEIFVATDPSDFQY